MPPIYRRQNFLINRRYIDYFSVKIGGKYKNKLSSAQTNLRGGWVWAYPENLVISRLLIKELEKLIKIRLMVLKVVKVGELRGEEGGWG